MAKKKFEVVTSFQVVMSYTYHIEADTAEEAEALAPENGQEPDDDRIELYGYRDCGPMPDTTQVEECAEISESDDD